MNDIVRYWRNLLLNYEHKTARKQRELDKARDKLTEEEFEERRQKLDADKWLRSCKLRFTRASPATVPSHGCWLLGEAGRMGNVTRESFREATKLTPMERIRAVTAVAGDNAATRHLELVQAYKSFLGATDRLNDDDPDLLLRLAKCP